jgi:type IV secretion system protein VirD4
MSKIYERFLQNKYGAFTPQSEFERDLARYNIESGTIAKPSAGKVLNNTQFGGVPLSFNGNVVFADSSDSHTLIMGSTGSKKSRLIAMPTINILAGSNESMIITDPKGELYAYSCAMLMEKGYSVFCFNLRNPATGDCWNPLIEPYNYYCDGNISKSCEMINDISLTISAAVKSEKDPYWHTSASSLFFGLTIHLFRYCKERNLPNHVDIGNVIELRTVLFRNGKMDDQVLKIIYEDSIVRNALSNCIFNADNTRKNILSMFDEIVRIFSLHPDLADAISRNNIHWDDIYEKPTACFIIMPDEKTTYHGVASLFVKQSYEMLIDIYHKRTEGSHCQRINYILDEFSSLPKITDFPAMISAARSLNIRFNIIVQSKHQLDGKYGEEAETIQDNCVNWIFLVSRELKLLETLSALCGTYYLDNSSRHHIRIEELQRLDKNRGEALVLHGRNKPYIATLPDIDKYPNKFGTVLTPDKRQIEKYSILSFEEYANFSPEKFKLTPIRSDNDITVIGLVQQLG